MDNGWNEEDDRAVSHAYGIWSSCVDGVPEAADSDSREWMRYSAAIDEMKLAGMHYSEDEMIRRADSFDPPRRTGIYTRALKQERVFRWRGKTIDIGTDGQTDRMIREILTCEAETEAQGKGSDAEWGRWYLELIGRPLGKESRNGCDNG